MGTDVVLRDTLVFDGETFDPALSTGITANLVSSLGKRTALEVEVADGGLIIYVPWVERNAGYYGLEVTGTCNSKKWATYADSLIHYTRATEMGVAEVTIESDYYDITQVVGYRYSTSPIDSVTATVDNQVGTPEVDADYDGKILNFEFRNLKGEPFTFDDLTPAQKEELRGLQGESAVFDPTTGNIAVIKQGTGDDVNSPMSQKAVTDELRYGWQPLDREIQVIGALYPLNGKYKTDGISANTASGFMAVSPGEIIRISPIAEDTMYRAAIVKNNSYSNNADIPFVDGTSEIVWKAEPEIVVIPNDGAYIFMSTKTNGEDRTPKFYTEIMVKDKLGEVDEKFINSGFASELDKGAFLKSPFVGSIIQGYRLKNSGGIEESASWSISPYIPLPSHASKIVIFYYTSPVSGVAAIHFYDKYFNYKSYLATSGTTNDGYRVYETESWDDNMKYARIGYSGVGLLAVDDVVLWSDGSSYLANNDDIFLTGSSATKLGIVGNDSTVEYATLGKLKTGAKYRIIPENLSAWNSYQSSLTSGQSRFYIGCIKPDGTRRYHNTSYKVLPIPPFVDFIAEENEYYYVAVRGARETPMNFTLIGPPEDNRLLEEKSLVRQAHYVGVDSGVIPSLGLLHISDLHGDQVAAAGILDALERYKEYIDDGISTGDMVNYASDASLKYPEGTAWWRATGLAEKMLFTLGNHDNATVSATEYDQKEDSECWDGKGIEYAIAQYFEPYDSEFGTSYHRPEGKCYWYKDYAEQKVRLIGLDCMHRFDGVMSFNNTTGRWEISSDGLKHKTDEQEQWLFDRLMETLTTGNAAYGYSVVVCGHFPLDDFSGDNMQWDENSHKFVCNRNENGGRVISQKTNDVVNFNFYPTTYTSYDRKFVWRNRVDNGYSQGAPWPNYTKGTENNVGEIIQKWQQDGGKFVAFFSGHVHGDLMYYPTKFPSLLTIAINQAGGIRPNNLGDKSDITYGRMVANYYAIDTFHGFLKIVRIGMKDTMHLMSLRYLCYDYINKKVISEG